MNTEEVKQFIKTKKTGKINKKHKNVPQAFPPSVTLKDIVESLPKDVFTLDGFKAYGSLFVTLFWFSFGIFLLYVTPWYLWPIGWVISGSSIAGLVSIGHDCVHRVFAKSNIVNDIVGTLLMLPLGYSYEFWKLRHKYQNIGAQVSNNKILNEMWSLTRGPTFWFASIAYWAQQHFDVSYFKPEDRFRVRVSNAFVYAFAVLFFSLMFWYTGIIGIVKYWLLPWLGYHFLMSTTTLLPRVAVDQKIANSDVVHLDYPKWLEFLTNDITLMLPRNVSQSIPHYRLRKAYKAMKSQWGDYLLETKFDWKFVSDLASQSYNVNPVNFSPLVQHPLVPVKDEIPSVPQPPQGFALWLKNTTTFLNTINWLHTFILIPMPLIALYGFYSTPLTLPTFIWTMLYYFGTGVGITAGYHRLFAHKAYKARQPTRFILLMLGTGATEGSARWWCRDHRAHHRYTDTDQDPYDANRGFWYSHIGWMLLKQVPGKIGRANIEDLNEDPWIRWQHKYYIYLATFMSIIFPTCVAGIFWGDWWGGYFYAAVFRQVLVHHSTFLVNSLAHYWGTAPFADYHTPRDSILTAVLTFGEGYHNFHHEFPSDYRNAIKFFQYDPTKWLIKALSLIGQTYDLKVFPENEVTKGQIQMKQKNLNELKENIDWGIPEHELPVISRSVFDELLKEGNKLVVLNDMVHDVSEFVGEHPGGSKILEAYVGKDATKAFNGGVYKHSNAARNLVDTMKIGVVDKKDNWDITANVSDIEIRSAKKVN